MGKKSAELKREEDEILAEQAKLDEARKKLKEQAKQHRDMSELQRCEAEADKIVKRHNEINERLAEIKRERERLAEQENQNSQEEIKNIMGANNRALAPTTATSIDKAIVRTTFAKLVRNEKVSNDEMTHYIRALANPSVENGQSATTTSTMFEAVTADSVGINNAGLFIPETVLLDILREDMEESPILNDIVTTAIRGMTKYPYLKRKDVAKKKAELDQTDSQNLEWDIISGKTGNYTTSIIITFEAMAQTIDEFVPYLMELIRASMREIINEDYVYGTGENDSVKGLIIGAISANYASSTKIQDVLEKAITKLPTKKRKGAKFYLAIDLYDKYAFAKNADGDYIHPVLGGTAKFSFAGYEIEADPTLKDGEYLFGNIKKNYKANIIKPLELGLDVSNKKRINEYTAHTMINATPIPDSIVYGKVGL